MSYKNSPTIEKIVNLDGRSKLLTGYFYKSERGSKAKELRLYPELNADHYFEIPESSVREVIEGPKGSEQTIVALRDGAEFDFVTRTRLSSDDMGRFGDVLTPTRKKLPPWMDRLTLYLKLANAALLEMYLGTESIPGTGQSGSPGDDL